MLDKEKLKEMMMLRYQSIRILRMIEQGHRDAKGIAKKTNAPTNVVHWYLKSLTK